MIGSTDFEAKQSAYNQAILTSENVYRVFKELHPYLLRRGKIQVSLPVSRVTPSFHLFLQCLHFNLINLYLPRVWQIGSSIAAHFRRPISMPRHDPFLSRAWHILVERAQWTYPTCEGILWRKC